MGGCAPPAVLDVLQPRPRASTCRSSPWHSRAGWQKARRKTKPNATLPPDCANAAFINKAALSCPLGRFLLEQSMDAAITDEAMLTRFRAALDDMYGANLERVVLFGSRARQDAGPDSDYDIAVFLKTLPDRWAELDRLAVLGVRFFDETGAMFEAKPYLTSAYDDHSPLMHEVRREGRDI
jgi:predicted nucleotidyltransferase